MDSPPNSNSSGAPENIVTAPILVVGAPRSGTTWLHRLMLSDERTTGGQESHFFVSFAQALRDFDRKIAFERPHGLGTYWTREELVTELRALWTRMMLPLVPAGSKIQCLVEKTPDHALHLDVIPDILPKAKVIHLVRDSRGVVASLLAASRSEWGQAWAPGDAAVAAETWNRFVSAAEQAQEALGPEHFLRVHYEHLHEDATSELIRVFRFLNLPLNEGEAQRLVDSYTKNREQDPNGTGYQARGAIDGQAVQEPAGFIRSGNVDGWRSELSRRESTVVWKSTSQLMEQLGYQKDKRGVQ